MGDWIAFWDSAHSIYVNARHRDVHYRTIAQDIRAHFPPGAVVPPEVSARTAAVALRPFGRANGFLGATLIGLLRTLVSDYWRLRFDLGLSRYGEAAMLAKLAATGFSARRAAANIGHNQARMTFIARRA